MPPMPPMLTAKMASRSPTPQKKSLPPHADEERIESLNLRDKEPAGAAATAKRQEAKHQEEAKSNPVTTPTRKANHDPRVPSIVNDPANPLRLPKNPAEPTERQKRAYRDLKCRIKFLKKTRAALRAIEDDPAESDLGEMSDADQGMMTAGLAAIQRAAELRALTQELHLLSKVYRIYNATWGKYRKSSLSAHSSARSLVRSSPSSPQAKVSNEREPRSPESYKDDSGEETETDVSTPLKDEKSLRRRSSRRVLQKPTRGPRPKSKNPDAKVRKWPCHANQHVANVSLTVDFFGFARMALKQLHLFDYPQQLNPILKTTMSSRQLQLAAMLEELSPVRACAEWCAAIEFSNSYPPISSSGFDVRLGDPAVQWGRGRWWWWSGWGSEKKPALSRRGVQTHRYSRCGC